MPPIIPRFALIDSSPAEQLEGDPDRWITTALVSGDPDHLSALIGAINSALTTPWQRMSGWAGKSVRYKQRFREALTESLGAFDVRIFVMSAQERTMRAIQPWLFREARVSWPDNTTVSTTFVERDGTVSRVTLQPARALPTLWIGKLTADFLRVETKRLLAAHVDTRHVDWMVSPDMFAGDTFGNPQRLKFFVAILNHLGVRPLQVSSFRKAGGEYHPFSALPDNLAGVFSERLQDELPQAPLGGQETASFEKAQVTWLCFRGPGETPDSAAFFTPEA